VVGEEGKDEGGKINTYGPSFLKEYIDFLYLQGRMQCNECS
jgi:hypothetical protein